MSSGLITIVNIEFGNRQLLQQGEFSLPLLAGRPSQQGKRMFASGAKWERECHKQTLAVLKMTCDMLTVEKQPLLNREKWILWSSLAKTIFKVRSGDAH